MSIAEVNGFVALTYTTPNSAVNPVLYTDLYRWSPQRQEYVLLAEGLPPTFSYRDMSAPTNVPFWYRIVAHAASLSDVFTSPSYTDIGDNWFITDGTTRLNVVALSADFGRTHILDEAEPLGRDYKVISRFESASREGSMSIDIRPEERDTIIPALYGMTEKSVAILSPYGDTFVGNITSLSVQDDIYGSAVVQIGFVEEGAS
jgi:hypothetical protein